MFNQPINLTTSDLTMNFETIADNENFANGAVGSQTLNAIASGNITLTTPDGGTTWILTPTLSTSFDRTGGAGDFATGGTGANGDGFGVWANGVYQLVLNGNDIAVAGQTLNNGQPFTATFTDGTGATFSEFASLYGDSAGNESINTALPSSKRAFGASFGDLNYAASMDANGDGQINTSDGRAFLADFGDSLSLAQ